MNAKMLLLGLFMTLVVFNLVSEAQGQGAEGVEGEGLEVPSEAEIEETIGEALSELANEPGLSVAKRGWLKKKTKKVWRKVKPIAKQVLIHILKNMAQGKRSME
ncbi:uncharacterized protein LOC101850871 [Aplysia californica]|uniref:Uncharacterized protein LOC101850871 n=1 Tax=Aplysia californica TaxID=6500 RepID=A0ABM0JGJ7_APLCA|nr:uncharacterized protein LOC101850871 [Aplysia californica]